MRQLKQLVIKLINGLLSVFTINVDHKIVEVKSTYSIELYFFSFGLRVINTYDAVADLRLYFPYINVNILTKSLGKLDILVIGEMSV